MAVQQKTQAKNGLDLKALGLKSPMEVIDILALLRVDGESVVSNDRDLLDQNQKTKAVLEYFHRKFNLSPNKLPYLASLVKHELKQGKLGWRKR